MLAIATRRLLLIPGGGWLPPLPQGFAYQQNPDGSYAVWPDGAYVVRYTG